MDSDLYDEFGNYIGPDLESDDDDAQSIYQDTQNDTDVCIFDLFFSPILVNRICGLNRLM